MTLKTHFHLFVFLLAIASPGSVTRASAIKWTELTPQQKNLVTFVLPASSPTIWDDGEVRNFLWRHGTRSGIYHAVGMLYRNQGADIDNSKRVIHSLLKLQHDATGRKLHGVWRTGLDTDREDENWREFVGTGLIVARERFGALMDAELIQEIDAALVRATEGAAKRNVLAHYTNIALMSAFRSTTSGRLPQTRNFEKKGKRKPNKFLIFFPGMKRSSNSTHPLTTGST